MGNLTKFWNEIESQIETIKSLPDDIVISLNINEPFCDNVNKSDIIIRKSVLALTIEHLRDPEREGNMSKWSSEWIDASKNLPEKDGKYLTITKDLSYEVNCWSGWRFCFYNDYRSNT